MRQVVHSITDVDEQARTATCAGCGPDSPVVFKRHRSIWACRRGDRRRSPEARSRRSRRANLKRSYGLTEQDYDALLATQDGTCAICDGECASGLRLAVDHDHNSGLVRGLLCNRCNRALGMFRDDPALMRRAVEYLTQ